MVPLIHIFERDSKIGQLYFECAGASGSRVKPSKTNKKAERKRHKSEHSSHTCFFCQNGHGEVLKQAPILAELCNDFAHHLKATKKVNRVWGRARSSGPVAEW